MPESEKRNQRWISILLTVQTLLFIGASLNRLTHFTTGPVAENAFLRWKDFHNLMVFPPLTVILAMVFRNVLFRNGGMPKLSIDIIFVVAVYFLGAGYGVHELGNYLSIVTKTQPGLDPAIREIIRFNDDDFSHWIFFASFIVMNTVMLLWQAQNPYQSSLPLLDKVICLANAAVLAVAIFLNLSRDDLGFDLYALLTLALIALYFWMKDKKQPINLYYMSGLWAGQIATAIAKIL